MPNKCELVLEGHCGRSPEKRYTPSGKAVTKFSVAVGDGKWDADTKRWSHTTWFDCVAFGDLGEQLAEEFDKGLAVHVEGRMVSRDYQDKTGVARRAWEVLVNTANLCFRDRTDDAKQRAADQGGIDDDSIPF